MKQDFLDPMSAAKALTRCLLNEADKLYPSTRKSMQVEYKLRNGIFFRS